MQQKFSKEIPTNFINDSKIINDLFTDNTKLELKSDKNMYDLYLAQDLYKNLSKESYLGLMSDALQREFFSNDKKINNEKNLRQIGRNAGYPSRMLVGVYLENNNVLDEKNIEELITNFNTLKDLKKTTNPSKLTRDQKKARSKIIKQLVDNLPEEVIDAYLPVFLKLENSKSTHEKLVYQMVFSGIFPNISTIDNSKWIEMQGVLNNKGNGVMPSIKDKMIERFGKRVSDFKKAMLIQQQGTAEISKRVNKIEQSIEKNDRNDLKQQLITNKEIAQNNLCNKINKETGINIGKPLTTTDYKVIEQSRNNAKLQHSNLLEISKKNSALDKHFVSLSKKAEYLRDKDSLNSLNNIKDVIHNLITHQLKGRNIREITYDDLPKDAVNWSENGCKFKSYQSTELYEKPSKAISISDKNKSLDYDHKSSYQNSENLRILNLLQIEINRLTDKISVKQKKSDAGLSIKQSWLVSKFNTAKIDDKRFKKGVMSKLYDICSDMHANSKDIDFSKAIKLTEQFYKKEHKYLDFKKSTSKYTSPNTYSVLQQIKSISKSKIEQDKASTYNKPIKKDK